ncbi:hypothetical protein Tco_0472678 [Tanacetum coccineum]
MPEQLPIKLSLLPLEVANNSAACHHLSIMFSSPDGLLLYVPNAYGQSLEALPSQLAASGSESHVPGTMSE